MFCWHTLSTDPPGTKPWITWGNEDECPIHHPELFEDVPEAEVHVDFNSGEPIERDVIGGPPGRHWIRKKVLMDPVKQIVNPVTEVRRHASRFIDEFGEEWVVIDGIETKIPSIAAAQVLLVKQDAVREEIRAYLDAHGIRDRTEKVKVTLDDGTETEIDMLPPGDAGANILQIGSFPDAAGLFENAARAQAQADTADAELERVRERARLKLRSPLIKIRDAIFGLLRKDAP